MGLRDGITVVLEAFGHAGKEKQGQDGLKQADDARVRVNYTLYETDGQRPEVWSNRS